ncbi:MAG: monothiol glutaredoxin [Francisellaceae bacterium]|jgi:monothiol glutaredoxin
MSLDENKIDENKVAEEIKAQISENRILLYMKGSPSAPQCGFSAQVAGALKDCGQKFAFVDILQNPDIRMVLPKVAEWPTFPQLYVEGELIGGCDIICELHEAGELSDILEAN